MRMWVNRVDPVHIFRGFYRLDIQIHDHRFLTASHEDTTKDLVLAGIDLLMGYERRDIDEVSRPGFRNEFEPLPPAHTRPAAYHINHTFQLSVVVRASFRVGFDDDCARPQFTGAGSRMRNRSRSRHAWCLRSIQIKLAARNHFHSVISPM